MFKKLTNAATIVTAFWVGSALLKGARFAISDDRDGFLRWVEWKTSEPQPNWNR